MNKPILTFRRSIPLQSPGSANAGFGARHTALTTRPGLVPPSVVLAVPQSGRVNWALTAVKTRAHVALARRLAGTAPGSALAIALFLQIVRWPFQAHRKSSIVNPKTKTL